MNIGTPFLKIMCWNAQPMAVIMLICQTMTNAVLTARQKMTRLKI